MESQATAPGSSSADQSRASNDSNVEEVISVESASSSSNSRLQRSVKKLTVVRKPSYAKKSVSKAPKATPVKRLVKCPKTPLSLLRCRVCYDLGKDVKRRKAKFIITKCGHVFCEPCIDQWRRTCHLNGKRSKCPVCRSSQIECRPVRL